MKLAADLGELPSGLAKVRTTILVQELSHLFHLLCLLGLFLGLVILGDILTSILAIIFTRRGDLGVFPACSVRTALLFELFGDFLVLLKELKEFLVEFTDLDLLVVGQVA
jgi:hypothetical protein